jgi:chaperonin GroES
MPKTATKNATETFRPLLDNLLIRPIAPETVTRGGIVLPDQGREKSERGTVLAVGPGRHNRDGVLVPVPDLKAGQTVLFQRYGGHEIEQDGEKLLIVTASEVLAVIEG